MKFGKQFLCIFQGVAFSTLDNYLKMPKKIVEPFKLVFLHKTAKTFTLIVLK